MEGKMRMQVLFASVLALGLGLGTSASFAVALPDGTCSGGRMQVTVKGGKIVAYRFEGKPYPIRASGPSVYKVGSEGALRVRAPKGTSFQGTFAMRGREHPATFKCK